jgi:DNA-binding NarL/FixJ family response regulator
MRTVLIGMNEESEQFLEAVRAGVNAYLLKDASAAEVISAIRATFRGEPICPPKLCTTLFLGCAKHFAIGKQATQGDFQTDFAPASTRQSHGAELNQ